MVAVIILRILGSIFPFYRYKIISLHAFQVFVGFRLLPGASSG